MKSAQKTKLKKLIVAVASSEARMIGECHRYRMPAFTCPRSAFSDGGSSGLIDESVKADTRNEIASAIRAPGAENAWTSRPPMLGPAAVDPRARVEREEKCRRDLRRSQVAHLGSARVECEDADERERNQRDLVAEEGNGFAGPEAAELALAERARQGEEPPRNRSDCLAAQGIVPVHARTRLMSPLIVFARSSTCGAPPSGGRSETGSSELTSPLRERASTHSVEPSRIPTLRSPEADLSATLPCETAPIVWSPEAVLTLTEEPASRIRTSPDALFTFSDPPASRICTSPDAEFTLASPPMEPT